MLRVYVYLAGSSPSLGSFLTAFDVQYILLRRQLHVLLPYPRPPEELELLTEGNDFALLILGLGASSGVEARMVPAAASAAAAAVALPGEAVVVDENHKLSETAELAARATAGPQWCEAASTREERSTHSDP
jgi:hypothetical protein